MMMAWDMTTWDMMAFGNMAGDMEGGSSGSFGACFGDGNRLDPVPRHDPVPSRSRRDTVSWCGQRFAFGDMLVAQVSHRW